LVKVRSIMELHGMLREGGRPAASLEDMEDGMAAGAAIDSGAK